MQVPQELAARKFAAAAESYIEWIDAFVVPGDGYRRELHRLIANLQSAGAELLDLAVYETQLSHSDDGDEFSAETRSDLYRALMEKLSLLPISAYRSFFSPLSLDEDPVVGWLQDDLADIYIDLHEGLTHFKAGRLIDALATWQLTYRSHWGHHATSAQTALWDYSI